MIEALRDPQHEHHQEIWRDTFLNVDWVHELAPLIEPISAAAILATGGVLSGGVGTIKLRQESCGT